jgi:hypothetical protein
MRKLLCVIGFFVIASVYLDGSVRAIDGVKGNTLRPDLADAKVQGCKVSRPSKTPEDKYRVKLGTLLEFDYTYPINPTTSVTPKKVTFKITVTTTGEIIQSQLGIRALSDGLKGDNGAIEFYFDTTKVGEVRVTISIDEQDYSYDIVITA